MTGYIAAFIVRDLLAEGYRVRGTVRSVKDSKKLAPLLALPGAAERLTFVEADMITDTDFVEVLRGCNGGLIHTATPIEIPMDGSPPASTYDEAWEKQIGPAVNGTKNLLVAAAKLQLPKVVLTSSVAAMRFTRNPPAVFDESAWSDEDYLKEILFKSGPACYALAKTVQEREAIAVSKMLNIPLAIINPALVVGPTLTPGNHNFSLNCLKYLMEGKGGPWESPVPVGTIPDKVKSWCDVREVSQAHVKALMNPSALGRYLVQSSSAHYLEIAGLIRSSRWWLRLVLPPLPLHTESPDGRPNLSCVKFDSSRAFGSGRSADQLGVKQIPLRDTVDASVDALIAQGHWKDARQRLACTAGVVVAAAVVATGVALSRRPLKA